MEPLIQKRPDMAAQLSEVLAERQMRNIRLLDGKEVGDPIETQVSLSQQFLSGIQSFLALGKVAVLTVVNRRAATKDLPDYR